MLTVFILQACFASLVSQDYVNGTDQEEIRTGKNNIFYCLVCVSTPFLCSSVQTITCLCKCFNHCRCWPVHTEVPGRGSADWVLLLAEKASAICAETRAGGQRGNLFHPLAFLTLIDGSEVIITRPKVHYRRTMDIESSFWIVTRFVLLSESTSQVGL